VVPQHSSSDGHIRGLHAAAGFLICSMCPAFHSCCPSRHQYALYRALNDTARCCSTRHCVTYKLRSITTGLPVTVRYCCCQVAAKAQRASVERSEVTRYEAYNALHGAKYVDPMAVGGGGDEDDDDGWGTPPLV